MKQYYAASLCRNGVLGGGIAAGEDGITYKTGKVTVPPKLRNLEMKYRNIFQKTGVVHSGIYDLDERRRELQVYHLQPKAFSRYVKG